METPISLAQSEKSSSMYLPNLDEFLFFADLVGKVVVLVLGARRLSEELYHLLGVLGLPRAALAADKYGVVRAVRPRVPAQLLDMRFLGRERHRRASDGHRHLLVGLRGRLEDVWDAPSGLLGIALDLVAGVQLRQRLKRIDRQQQLGSQARVDQLLVVPGVQDVGDGVLAQHRHPREVVRVVIIPHGLVDEGPVRCRQFHRAQPPIDRLLGAARQQQLQGNHA
eukprot:scaffold770_cov255-Pinguiococcus_pyrenoidosus.AAC.48